MEPLLEYRHDYPTYHLLAEANYQLNRLDKARKHYQEAIKLNPESAADRYELGNICLASRTVSKCEAIVAAVAEKGNRKDGGMGLSTARLDAGDTAAVQRKIKKIFDPSGILNPGKLCF